MIKKILSALVAAAVSLSFSPRAFAEIPYSSEEVLYGILEHSGSVENIYAVVITDSSRNTKAEYYGPFLDVKNLSDTREIKLEKDRVLFSAPQGRFYFQSSLKETALPWDIKMSYSLNGEKINAEEFAGRSGKFSMEISVKKSGIADSTFFNSYLMQISLRLDSRIFENIQSADATIANSGADKLVTFTVLPGKEAELKLSADVTDFAMQGITLSAVPYSADSSLGDISDMSSGLKKLTDAIAKLSDGSYQLYSGAEQLKGGATKFGEGLYALSANSASLVSASEMFLNMFNMFKDSLVAASKLPESGEISDLPSLIAAMDSICKKLDDTAAAAEITATNLTNAKIKIDAAFISVPESVENDYNFLNSCVFDTDIMTKIKEKLGDGAEIKFTASLNNLNTAANGGISAKKAWNEASKDYENAIQMLLSLSISLRAASESIKNFKEILTGITGTESGDALDELIKKASELSDSYARFHEGLVAYTSGVDQLAANWGSLYDGIVQLTGGSSELSYGTGQLNEGTQGIPGKVDEMLSPFTGEEFIEHSFLSEKNTNTKAVQFVLSTKAIEIENKAEEASTAKEEKTSLDLFWERLTALF